MKYNLIEILYCPKCHGRFKVHNAVEKNGEVIEGALRCEKCGVSFPIINYIARLVEEEANYSKSWGKLWRETAEIIRDSFTGVPFYYNAIHGEYNEDGIWRDGYSPYGFEWPTSLKGETILEVGPGTGNCSEHLVNTGADLICVDMSNAIDTFPEELLTKPNINVVQADINEAILQTEHFDRIWLFQVLQHTPSPPDTLKTMWTFLKQGGELGFTSYEKPFNPWFYRFTRRMDDETVWKLIAYWVPKLVPLKYRFLKARKLIFPRLFVKLLEPFDPRNIYFSTLAGFADQYVHGALWNRTQDRELLMKYIIINTFDCITPEYINNASEQTIRQWTLNAEFSSVKTWVSANGVMAKAIK